MWQYGLGIADASGIADLKLLNRLIYRYDINSKISFNRRGRAVTRVRPPWAGWGSWWLTLMTMIVRLKRLTITDPSSHAQFLWLENIVMEDYGRICIVAVAPANHCKQRIRGGRTPTQLKLDRQHLLVCYWGVQSWIEHLELLAYYLHSVGRSWILNLNP